MNRRELLAGLSALPLALPASAASTSPAPAEVLAGWLANAPPVGIDFAFAVIRREELAALLARVAPSAEVSGTWWPGPAQEAVQVGRGQA